MKSGSQNAYDQFFKQARKVAMQEPAQSQPRRSGGGAPKSSAQPGKSSRKISFFEDEADSFNTKQSSREMAAELRRRVTDRNQSTHPGKKAKQNRRKAPVKLIFLSVVGMCMAGAGLYYLDDLEKLAKKVEISFIGASFASESPAKSEGAGKPGGAAKTEGASKEKKAEDGKVANAEKKEASEEKKREFTQDEINHFAKLNDRKRELDSREEELSRMETELQAQKAELDKKLADLESTRRSIASILNDRVKVDEQKVDTLVQMYSSMKPQQAAKVFESMDEDLAVEILGRMKKKNAAEVMNLVKAEKAQILSEKYAGYKRK